MKRIRLALLLTFILLFMTGTVVTAQDFPSPKGYVNDFAYLLSGTAAKNLEARLVRLERETSAEVAVVTIVTRGDYSIEEYAADLFQKWGIGKKDKDNGVLFLVALVDRELRIEVGYGLEPIITDGRAGRIRDKEVLPHFRDGDYEAGIIAGVAAIEDYIRQGTPPAPLEENPIKKAIDSLGLMWLLFILGIISMYVMSFMARTRSIWLGGVWGAVMGLVLGFAIGGLLAAILMPIGMAVIGTILDIILSRNYKSRRSSGRSTGWGNTWGGFGGGGSSGGFGGFGGGSSGGGGASGRW